MQSYLVFARSAYADPLSYQGRLEAPQGQSPDRLALDRYGSDWVELVLIPEHEVFWVLDETPATSLEAQP